MMHDREVAAELLKQAIIATDDYLEIYKAAKSGSHVSDSDISTFGHRMQVAVQALRHFEDAENHASYIEDAIACMNDIFNDGDHTVNSMPSVHEGLEHGEVDHDELEHLAKKVKWHHIADTYKDEDFDHSVNEGLSAANRMQKRMAFARTSVKRQMAEKIKLKRASSMDQLKARAKVAARRLLMEKFLRGRQKAQLSPAEKDRIEQQVKNMKNIQNVLVQKLIPHVRALERQRLSPKPATKNANR